MKTWMDLINTQKPFVVSYLGTTWIYYPSDNFLTVECDGAIVFSGDTGQWLGSLPDLTISSDCYLDWFEAAPSSTKEQRMCTCDFYSVVLVAGCKCGGK